MAGIFLDTNAFFDPVKRKNKKGLKALGGHELYISPLSVYILIYVYKYKIPDKELDMVKELFNLTSFDSGTTQNSLIGPTKDF